MIWVRSMKIKSLTGLPENACCLVKAEKACTSSIASRFSTEHKSHTSSIAFGLAAGPSVARFNRVHIEHSSPSCARVKRCFTHPRSGFTLLEVMVALAIFAVAAIALTKVAMQYTQSTSNAILRTKAQFVAMNEVAMMEMNQEWLDGTQSKQVTSQGETWQIDKKAQSTISPKIQRIELQVSLFNNEQGKVEAGITNLVFFNYPAKARTQ